MKVFLCYKHSSVEIKWDLPFLPRIGEYISITELLSEKESKKLGAKNDYLKIINISWFLNKNSRKSSVEILLE
ncbi:hypothetical protein [Chryseobacterium mulctrae]|uniref:hypothetical protein n=1 Tax=Chryseobacterium mulctrae TaxID=2576777 RepID=UPI0011161EB8|nr:hypothetical protein [Chryseobacterium mulctrae]